MLNRFEHKFAIKRVVKTTDDEYIKALRIYNDTTPHEIKTPTNEITYWLEKQNSSTPFEVYAFILYLNDEVIGLSITTYIKRTKVVIDEYLAVYNHYRIQTIFLSYESLIQNFYKENGIEISYYLTEISHKGSGQEMDRESKISLKLMCVEEYGKIEALYYALPLGLTNHESNFVAYLYIKGVEPIQSITVKTYRDVVESIYYDYWYSWYIPVLTSSELSLYKNIIDEQFRMITTSLTDYNSPLPVIHSNCDCLITDADISKGSIPTKKKRQVSMFVILTPIVFILPLLIILGYSWILKLCNISITSESTIIGTVLSTIITSLTALLVAYKKS